MSTQCTPTDVHATFHFCLSHIALPAVMVFDAQVNPCCCAGLCSPDHTDNGVTCIAAVSTKNSLYTYYTQSLHTVRASSIMHSSSVGVPLHGGR